MLAVCFFSQARVRRACGTCLGMTNAPETMVKMYIPAVMDGVPAILYHQSSLKNGGELSMSVAQMKSSVPRHEPNLIPNRASIPLNNSVAAAIGVLLLNPYGISSTSSASLLRRGRQF
ncbi:hypothetical protein STAS_23343 [Striga asiatica]|uniref:Uncharacterized protein n=1 Tax=Striga asiatica TaxID=4170 RepID=A0A5A7QME3_STRAF|nr:hypothetical protein STAS_23343 [Striga asiatica]